MKIIGYAVLLATSLSVAQTSQEFHSRYGESDTERFTIREGIGLTVEYGSDGLACQIEIKAKQLLNQRDQPPKFMSSELVDELVSELVPSDIRGRKAISFKLRTGCSEAAFESNENVTIGRATDLCLPLKPERERSVTISFKRQACPDAGLHPAGADAVLYQKGLLAVKENQCSVARTMFQTVINTYPNSEYATKARMILKKPRIAGCEF